MEDKHAHDLVIEEYLGRKPHQPLLSSMSCDQYPSPYLPSTMNMSQTKTTTPRTPQLKDAVKLNGHTVSFAEDHPEVEDIRASQIGNLPQAGREILKLSQRYDDLNVSPLWDVMHQMVPPRPNPKAAPTEWHYEDMRPELMKAAEIVSAEEAERRVLILVNETMKAPCTTDTIYGGLQIVLPGEIAPAHRHRAFALRFIIEGTKGFTAVSGEKIEMFPGDVILTPSWTWHDHGNEGSDPVIWLDGLDLPLWQFLPINILEQYTEPRFPSEPCTESQHQFPWADVAKALDAEPAPHSVYQYRRKDGSHLSKTISAQAEKVAASHTTVPSKEVFSFVYHVYDGEGCTTIKDPRSGITKTVEWKSKDTFAVPAWSEITHTCKTHNRSAYLFAINDRPIVEALTFVSVSAMTGLDS